LSAILLAPRVKAAARDYFARLAASKEAETEIEVES